MPIYWTPEEEQIIRENYPAGGADFCEEIIRLTTGWSRGRRNVMQKAMKMRIKYQGPHKSTYKKGRIPENKGKKMSKQLYEKCAPTMFKKGHAPHNQKAKGDDISIRTDNRGVKILYIRLAVGKWEYLSRHTWRSFFGKIPPGHIIIHKDGDTMNCRIENLAMITKAENARRNHNTAAIKRKAAELGDEYIISYMRRYEGIKDIDLETARANGLIDVWREQIRLKRLIASLKSAQR